MPSQLFFRPSAIELKLYRKFRADQAHNPTKLDHYPINIKGSYDNSGASRADWIECRGRMPSQLFFLDLQQSS